MWSAHGKPRFVPGLSLSAMPADEIFRTRHSEVGVAVCAGCSHRGPGARYHADFTPTLTSAPCILPLQLLPQPGWADSWWISAREYRVCGFVPGGISDDQTLVQGNPIKCVCPPPTPPPLTPLPSMTPSPRAAAARKDSAHRGTSLIRNSASPRSLGPYSRTMARVSWWSYGGVPFLMSEVPLQRIRDAHLRV